MSLLQICMWLFPPFWLMFIKPKSDPEMKLESMNNIISSALAAAIFAAAIFLAAVYCLLTAMQGAAHIRIN